MDIIKLIKVIKSATSLGIPPTQAASYRILDTRHILRRQSILQTQNNHHHVHHHHPQGRHHRVRRRLQGPGHPRHHRTPAGLPRAGGHHLRGLLRLRHQHAQGRLPPPEEGPPHAGLLPHRHRQAQRRGRGKVLPGRRRRLHDRLRRRGGARQPPREAPRPRAARPRPAAGDGPHPRLEHGVRHGPRLGPRRRGPARLRPRRQRRRRLRADETVPAAGRRGLRHRVGAQPRRRPRAGGTPFAYTDKEWMRAMKDLGGADAVFDPLGFESWDESFSILSPSGILVGYGGNLQSLNESAEQRSVVLPTMKLLARGMVPFCGKRTRFYYITRDDATFETNLKALFEMLGEGKITVPIKKVWELEDIQEAHKQWANGTGVGSLVVRVAGEAKS
ncbi:Protein indc11 [Colletotrichum sidae]|uniref:Protein indc11 n=1 Tax=Colletotrichum sidae TaxID=1347389 RepID=A0A4R8T3Y1_9PEZI|nr:Protein indc11 [Colletotrichum sidae]